MVQVAQHQSEGECSEKFTDMLLCAAARIGAINATVNVEYVPTNTLAGITVISDGSLSGVRAPKHLYVQLNMPLASSDCAFRSVPFDDLQAGSAWELTSSSNALPVTQPMPTIIPHRINTILESEFLTDEDQCISAAKARQPVVRIDHAARMSRSNAGVLEVTSVNIWIEVEPAKARADANAPRTSHVWVRPMMAKTSEP
ncbi:hypothetical protein TESG_02091 [Trichophyton tonsurans CBS 112818]|uniref:Uncharacterized protein n=1 Tax=Trichophyton tonsurans (strain CBS 112818) TaxID=647933 RepID=F2RTD2_TRIT1|nr:hypothetical protein TESG_02091 [Trichophyton tonsurans CBS 112818]